MPKTLTLALALTLLGACADSATAPKNAAAPPVPGLSDAQIVAQGLALSMRDASIREDVHAAMRASLFNEHKLVLQEFLSTSDGRDVLAAAAAALKLGPSALEARIASLPSLDFYLPFEAHRVSWKADADVYVAVAFDGEAPALTGYGSDGGIVSLRREDGVPAMPLIILHPAELKLTRNAPQANIPGDLIQEPTDGVVATEYRAGGPLTIVMPCEGCDGGGGGGGGTVTPGVYINHFNIQEGDGWFGDSEMRFHSYTIVGYYGLLWGVDGRDSWIAIDASCHLGSYAQNGVQEDRGYDGLFLLSPNVTNVASLPPCVAGRTGFYAIHIIEDDGGLTLDDDDFGYRFYAPPASTWPFGATVGTVQSFYANTESNVRTAYLRIQYR